MTSANHLKISVIVPFYNLEGCVDRCVSSLLDQTYDDYELLLIDDGSTDDTFQCIKKYETDSKVRVFRKQNGGLSQTRNYGAQHANGDYLTFVDGDDIVSPFYLESLSKAVTETGADLVIGGMKRVPESEVASCTFERPAAAASITKEALYADIMYERTLPSGCAHLAPREVYLANPFPEGVFYEEIASIATYLEAATECAVVSEPIYGYVMRDGSIVHRRTARLQQAQDYQAAIEVFERSAQRLFSEDSPERIYFRSLHASRLFRLLSVVQCESPEQEGAVRTLQCESRQQVKRNRSALMSDANASRGNKMRFTLLTVSPGLYLHAFDLFDRMRK